MKKSLCSSRNGLIPVLLILLISPFFFHCGKKPASVKAASGNSYEKTIQTRLDGLTYSHYGYKQIRPVKRDRDAWKKEHLEDLKDILSGLKQGYVIELRGHSDSRESRKKEITISHEGIGRLRSQFLKRLLLANKLDAGSFQVTSAGADEPVSGISGTDPGNRRVTFHIMKRE
ncbi:MAG: hypothetical protein PHF84_03815 [bacterium]|nr:hypothetical protein [bacterium]